MTAFRFRDKTLSRRLIQSPSFARTHCRPAPQISLHLDSSKTSRRLTPRSSSLVIKTSRFLLRHASASCLQIARSAHVPSISSHQSSINSVFVLHFSSPSVSATSCVAFSDLNQYSTSLTSIGSVASLVGLNDDVCFCVLSVYRRSPALTCTVLRKASRIDSLSVFIHILQDVLPSDIRSPHPGAFSIFSSLSSSLLKLPSVHSACVRHINFSGSSILRTNFVVC